MAWHMPHYRILRNVLYMIGTEKKILIIEGEEGCTEDRGVCIFVPVRRSTQKIYLTCFSVEV